MKSPLFLGLGLVLVSAAWAGQPTPLPEQPLPRRLERESWTLELSGAFLRKVVSPDVNSKYRIAPLLLTLKSPGYFHWNFVGGTLAIRNTVTLLAESLFRGPETHYLGLALRPSLDWWCADERFFLYFSPGGGLGVIDSRGLQGGQGQDFTFNILVGAGLGWKMTDRTSLRAGILYQHLSNGGQTDPNPGLNALGPELGFSYSF